MDERKCFTPGETAARSMLITLDTIDQYAALTGDQNPVHVDPAYAEKSFFKGQIAHGMLVSSLISSVLGNQLPGPGCVYLSQTLKFVAPVRPGDRVTAQVIVSGWDPEKGRVSLDTVVTNQRGEQVVVGEARLVMAAFLG